MRLAGHFLPGPAGPLAVTLWRPAGTARLALLHVPAFGDEMNKSRRTVAQQARALAAQGVAVAALDPSGTGDSAGEHDEATWARWCDDVAFTLRWLREQTGAAVGLWGLRLGALLAAELASRPVAEVATLLLWQPVVAGRTFFNQFLRMGSAQQVAGTGEGDDRKVLRARLEAGQVVEVAGYDLAAALLKPAEALEIGTLPAPACPVLWLDVVAAESPSPLPVSVRACDTWRRAGARVEHSTVSGPSFWTSVEIEEAPALVTATTQAVLGVLAAGEAGSAVAREARR